MSERSSSCGQLRPVMPKPGDFPGFCFVRHRGFTLVELVVVIVIFGILAAVAVPRLFDSGFSARGLHDETVAALRYAQKSAVAARRLVCVQFTDTGLTAFMAGNFGDADCSKGGALPGPSGSALTVSASGGATYAAQPGNALTFTPLGQPSARTVIPVQGLPDSLMIVVEQETGYVH